MVGDDEFWGLALSVGWAVAIGTFILILVVLGAKKVAYMTGWDEEDPQRARLERKRMRELARMTLEEQEAAKTVLREERQTYLALLAAERAESEYKKQTLTEDELEERASLRLQDIGRRLPDIHNQ